MKHVNYKWLLIGILSYIACSIVASALLSIGVMFMFGHIDPSQLKAVQPTATIFDIGEPLIGFTVAILVAYWVARKTLETQTRTIWFYAGFLSIYGLVSILVTPSEELMSGSLKLLAPWVIAILARKWAESTKK